MKIKQIAKQKNERGRQAKEMIKLNKRCIYCNLPSKDDLGLCKFHLKSSKGGFYKLKK